jgi:hypothetical protein
MCVQGNGTPYPQSYFVSPGHGSPFTNSYLLARFNNFSSHSTIYNPCSRILFSLYSHAWENNINQKCVTFQACAHTHTHTQTRRDTWNKCCFSITAQVYAQNFWPRGWRFDNPSIRLKYTSRSKGPRKCSTRPPISSLYQQWIYSLVDTMSFNTT